MKTKLLAFFILATVALGAVCAWQWKTLRQQQAQVASLEVARSADAAAREEQHDRMVLAEKERVRLEREVQEFNAVTANLRTSEAKQSSNVTALAQRLQSTAGGTNDGKGGVFGKDMGKMLGTMMKDPAMREMMRGQQKAMMGMMYSGLYKDLNLPKEQQEKLAELLLDGQMKNIEAAQGLFDKDGEGGPGKDPAAVKQAAANQRKESEEKIRALLGDEKYAAYDDYQKNIGVDPV